VQLTEALIELVKAGLGVAVMSHWAVAPHVRAGTIVALGVTSDGVYKHWSAVLPRHLAGADYVDEFLRLLVEKAPARQVRAVVPFRGRRREPVAG
jgi:LysR family transcriptional regulator for metE and metH